MCVCVCVCTHKHKHIYVCHLEIGGRQGIGCMLVGGKGGERKNKQGERISSKYMKNFLYICFMKLNFIYGNKES